MVYSGALCLLANGALAKKIGESDSFLALTAIAIVALSLAIFALVILTVLA